MCIMNFSKMSRWLETFPMAPGSEESDETSLAYNSLLLYREECRKTWNTTHCEFTLNMLQKCGC